MNGDEIVWLVILLTIIIGDGLALYLYKKENPFMGFCNRYGSFSSGNSL